ncbi:MAG: hypothetical protein JKY94_10075 [Rhodobacteraceae bacterium]|nr:hypothetical protein [Paracoccaceae bacterium]
MQSKSKNCWGNNPLNLTLAPTHATVALMVNVLVTLAFIAVMSMLGAQFYLGFIGLDYLMGPWTAWAGIVTAVLFRTTFPLMFGTYFGIVNVIGWPWWAGVLFAIPGLLLAIPVAVEMVYHRFMYWFNR